MSRRPPKKSARKAAARATRKPPKRGKVAAAGSKSPSKTKPAPVAADPLDAFILAGAQALDLNIDKAWLPAIRLHLKATLALGASVAAFALPDETDAAPVFKA